jgi:hypothetical protein
MFELDLSVRERGRVETEEVVEIITEEDALRSRFSTSPPVQPKGLQRNPWRKRNENGCAS